MLARTMIFKIGGFGGCGWENLFGGLLWVCIEWNESERQYDSEITVCLYVFFTIIQ